MIDCWLAGLPAWLPTLPIALQALVCAAHVAPWRDFFALCARRQFSLLARDTELLQGRLFQVWGGTHCSAHRTLQRQGREAPIRCRLRSNAGGQLLCCAGKRRAPPLLPACLCLQVVLAGVVVGTLFLQIDLTMDESRKFLGVSFTSGEMCVLSGTAAHC